MNSKAKTLLAVGMLNTAGSSVASTFINVFLMRATHDSIHLVVLQNMMNYIVVLIAFIGGTKLLSKLSITSILRLGILANALYYVIILLLRSDLVPFIIPLGIFSGLGSGLYWCATNLLIGDLVSEQFQGKFFSYQQTMSFIFGVVIPALSGYIIVHFGGLDGYYVLFSISTPLYLAAIILVRSLPGFKLQEKMNLMGVLRLRKNPYWQANRFQNFSSGFKTVLNSMFFMLFAYLLFRRENVIGNFTSVQALISVVSSLLFARFFRREMHQRSVYLLVCGLTFLTFLFLAIFPNPAMMILAWLIFGIIQSWGSSISSSITYQLSTRAKSGFSQREYVVATEFPIAAGRVFGLAFALVLTQILPSALTAYRVIFVAIGIMWLLEFLFVDRKVGWLKNE